LSRIEFATVEEAAEYVILNDLDKDTKDYLIALDNDELISLHFTFGMFLRNTCEITDKSLLYMHRDDISMMLIEEIVKRLKSER